MPLRSALTVLGREGHDDSGVSPVVGMILVLAISVVAIAATMYWGLPAIDEMKANVEIGAVEAQFRDLDSTIQELIAGTTARTAKRWQPSISRGDLQVNDEVETWVYAIERWNSTGANHSLVYGGFADGDHSFLIRNNRTDATNVKVEAYRVQGSASEETLAVSLSSGSSSQMAGTLNFPNTTETTFYVWNATTGQPVPLLYGTFHLKAYAGSSLIAEAWFVNVGRATYTLESSLGTRHVSYVNGAILTGSAGNYVVDNSPGIVPPTVAAGTYREYARVVTIDGNQTFAGSDRFDALVSLYATNTLASLDCARSDHTDCVQSVKLFILGDHAEPWRAYLTNTNIGYAWQESSLTLGTGETVTWLENRQDQMAYTLLQSIVTVR